MITPYTSSTVEISSAGTNQGTINRSGLYTYVNPDNTLLEIQAANFFAGITSYNFEAYDLIYITASDGVALAQFTDESTVTVVIS